MLNDRLHAETSGTGEPLILVHGFTQTARSWDRIAARLRRRYRVTVVDAPGHGGSTHLRLSLAQTAEMVAQQCGPATYIGYSMGARLCLHIATQRPELVDRLALLGATAGFDDPVERADRKRTDEALATTIERDGIAVFLDRWLAQPMFAGVLDADGSDRLDRLGNTASGLASSLRLCGTGAQASLWPVLAELTMPVLVMAGERDAKFIDLGRRLSATIGTAAGRSRGPGRTGRPDAGAEFAIVPDAGHAAHLEQPDAFLALLTGWLADHPTFISPR